MMNVPPGGGPLKDRRRGAASLDQLERQQPVGRRDAGPLASPYGADRFAASFQQTNELMRAERPLDANGVA